MDRRIANNRMLRASRHHVDVKSLIAYCALVTGGFGLLLVGITWLTFLGVGLAVFAGTFSCRQGSCRIDSRTIVICLAGAIWSSWGADAFHQTQFSLAYRVLVVAAWLWSLGYEVHKIRTMKG
jgi:hypothetical protein